MTTVTVSGFTTADIHAARDAAGAGGKLLFPAGTYNVDGLTANVADQTWHGEGEGYTILKKVAASAGPIVLLGANGLRLRNMTVDGNRANCPAGDGIDGTGFGVDMLDVTLQNVASWGVGIDDGELVMDRCKVKNTGLAGVIWRATGMTVVRRGPQINQCLIDRSGENPTTIQSGGILIQSKEETAPNLVDAPRVTNCELKLPWTSVDNQAVLIEMLRTRRALISGNNLSGGRIGVTYGGLSNAGHITSNNFHGQCAYAIELGCIDSNVHDNYGLGYAGNGSGGSSLYGITANPATRSTQVYCNRMIGFTMPLQIGYLAEVWANWENR